MATKMATKRSGFSVRNATPCTSYGPAPRHGPRAQTVAGVKPFCVVSQESVAAPLTTTGWMVPLATRLPSAFCPVDEELSTGSRS